ncbi:carbohydrate-binding module family 18 [Xylaria sp. FL0064]|nr:carbohydrate-binding module family 18 [Xylaria sp. FL0064]
MTGRALQRLFLFLLLFYLSPVLGLPRPGIRNLDVDTCANFPSPVEVYLDTAAKVRNESSIVKATRSARTRRQTANPSDPHGCSETNPCGNGACCGKNGVCGFGPTYCGTNGVSPNDACWSNCDAKAPCGEFTVIPGVTCPLNVCCSQYGFCGTTDEYCQEGCQSNCEQPFSLTHLHLAFGYITPGSYDIVMMPGVPDSVITDIMALKKQNPGIKMIISLGGWSFSDNGTNTQSVFGDVVGDAANRFTFIIKLLAFLYQHGFDGVDFDWEYPGAGDRGGNPSDGLNFEQLLFELELVNRSLIKRILVSFTTPTSYWYLQHFSLSSIQWVDWTNLMSYDLHGTWDGPGDQIGNIVMAHTNLTEIGSALSLFWRNGVDPAKINLGMGFYGRSFQLADPNCWKPGCPFKGGAEAGTCSGQSGILSYNEITNIIKQYNIDPYWDKDDAVKYMTWGGDQWVSYDDSDTFQQKIKYANEKGLGGLLIWALDQDTPDLDAMQALLYPKTLNAFENTAVLNWQYWQEADQGACHLTACGKSCSVGEILISTQSCDGSYDANSANHLCCPVASAPNPKDCVWRGNAPYCNGRCHPDEVPMMQNRWGDHGKYCRDGNYVYCCKPSKDTGCRTTDCGGSCDDNEVSMAGKFFDDCSYWDNPKQLCCKKPLHFDQQSCYWQGKDGSCYDNNCKFGVEVQIAESYDGDGKTCGFQWSRKRVFCCKPSDSGSLFSPVPLEYLFKNPPTGDDVDTKYTLDVDNTFGGRVTSDSSEDPNDASFGFVIMASPEAIQTSLDRRDGSHWDLFGCNDAVSDGEHTVQMACVDDSPLSNCYKIGLGHGVPGTILEMPDGCGPGRYAVAKDMTPAVNQTLPEHIARRSRVTNPVIYDLTFDYDFTRVPRDLGDTQIRIDYSNQEGYWDGIVNKAADKREKTRSLDEFGGNHRRWLEHHWREDHKGGLMPRSELHERWFGTEVVDWLFNVAYDAPLIDHSISQTFTAILLQEHFQCNYGGVDVEAKLDVKADINAKIDTQFGLTIITMLPKGSQQPDLSQSFMYLRNRGEIDAVFTIDAIVKAGFNTGETELFGLQNFNALFSVPGIITVGPNFRLFGYVEMEASISGHIEAAVTMASWDTQLSFPDQGPDYDLKNLKNPESKTQSGTPTFDWSVETHGEITAHVKPQVSFGITWGKVFNKLPNCEVDLVVDGWATVYLKASTTTRSVCYGVITGANLFAALDAPSQLNWILPTNPWMLGEWSADVVPETCPISANAKDIETRLIEPPSDDLGTGLGLEPKKRAATVIGPLLHLPFGLTCPTSEEETGDVAPCPLCGSGSSDIFARDDAPGCIYIPDGDETPCPAELQTRELVESIDNATFRALLARNELEKRDRKVYDYLTSTKSIHKLRTDTYPNCGTAVKSPAYTDITRYYGYDANQQDPPCVPNMYMNTGNEAFFSYSAYVTEHVFEAQTILQFVRWLAGQGNGPPTPQNYTMPSQQWVEYYLLGFNPKGGRYYDFRSDRLGPANPDDDYFWAYMTRGLGGSANQRELVLAYGKMNRQKETFFKMHSPLVDQNDPRKTRIYPTQGQGQTPDSIWNKFMRPSNFIDLTFIDGTLQTIEDRANTYCTTASNLYVVSRQNPTPKYYTPALDGWIRAAFGPGGFCNKPKLPRPGGTGSTYGAWGNADMTLDYNKRKVSLANPSP